MGTNFYYIKKLSRKEKDDIINNLDKQLSELKLHIENNTLHELSDDWVDNIRKLLPEEKHIGKRSYSWRFLWEHTIGNSLDEIKNKLSDVILYDEYCRSYKLDEFLDEIKHCLYEGNRSSDVDYITKDGLRFSKYEDFR